MVAPPIRPPSHPVLEPPAADVESAIDIERPFGIMTPNQEETP